MPQLECPADLKDPESWRKAELKTKSLGAWLRPVILCSSGTKLWIYTTVTFPTLTPTLSPASWEPFQGWKCWARMSIPGAPPSWSDPPWQTCRSLAMLQEPLVGVLVAALKIMMSLLMGHPLGVQAEWTAIHHFPFDPDTYSFTQCSLSGLPRAFLSYKGLNRFA